MSRPFPDTFDRDSNPASPVATTPTSYRTNVNRQKTKKWVEAKPVDYGGDDWGDDYDDENEDTPPPPPSKPTGLRQRGQSTGNKAAVESKPYGELQGASAQTDRSVTNPAGGPRRNSFIEGEEKRAFSTNTAPPPNASDPRPQVQSTGPPPLSISTQQPSVTGLRKATPGSAQPGPGSTQAQGTITSPQAQPSARSSSISSSQPYTGVPLSASSIPISETSDYQARSDYSPTAAPAPLQARGAPGDASTSRFPPRGSSITQSSADISDSRAQSGVFTPSQTQARSERSNSASSPPPAKTLPFIRPADIYRRIEEEREKERLSMDSSRPSMDSIMGTRPNEISSPPPKERRSVEGLGLHAKSKLSIDGDETNDPARKPGLEPVIERKSEFGFDNFNPKDLPPSPGVPPHVTQQAPTRESDLYAPQPVSARNDDTFGNKLSDELEVKAPRPSSTSPKLPDLHRMSGFGMDIFNISSNAERLKAAQSDAPPSTSDSNLQREPSLGFTSLVHQAFDRTDDASLPDTPASRTGSTVKRTDSESTGTTGISPIMSRVPSKATADLGRLENHDHATPTIEEVPETESRGASPDAPRNAAHLNDEAVPQTFRPGHRRDISTPSPANSPARTPDVEVTSKTVAAGEAPSISEVSDTSSPKSEAAPAVDKDILRRPSLPGAWVSSYDYSTRSESQETPADETPTRGLASDFQSRAQNDVVGPVTVAPSVDKQELEQKSSTPVSVQPGSAMLAAEAPSLERSISSTSTIPPPPLPKDTPKVEGANEGYFPVSEAARSTVPLAEQNNLTIQSPRPTLPSAVPSRLSIDVRETDETSDRLRKDIIRQLSPEMTSKLGFPEEAELKESVDSPRRDSTYDYDDIYDNYRGSIYQASPEEPSDIGIEQANKHPLPDIPQEFQETSPISPAEPSIKSSKPIDESATSELPVIAPLRTRNSPSPQRPLTRKFSWEEDTEAAQAASTPGTSATPEPSHDTQAEQQPIAPELSEEPTKPHEQEPQAVAEHDSSNHHAGETAAGAALVTGAILAHEHEDSQSESRDVEPQPVSEPMPAHLQFTSPLEAEHPNKPSSPPTSPLADQITSPTQLPLPASPLPPSSPNARLATFKEISELSSPEERINKFNETQRQFATMDTGLLDWVWFLASQLEPPGTSNAQPHSPGGKPSSPAAPSPPFQQPYFQQYLNASSPTAPVASKPSGVFSGSQHGFSSGGRLSTQQVQAKSKDLLHTAGVFGGKASKAGKGLLAKGKNRFLGGGSGDKTNLSSSNFAAPPRRSSWGMPLALSRSSLQIDDPRHSRDLGTPRALQRFDTDITPDRSSTGLTRNGRPKRASLTATLRDLRDSLSKERRGSRDDNDSISLSSRSTAQTREAILRETAPTSRDPIRLIPQHDDAAFISPAPISTTPDTVGPPAPIGKYQPSWDPFTSTPIVEEDDASYFGEHVVEPHLNATVGDGADEVNAPAPKSVADASAVHMETSKNEDDGFEPVPSTLPNSAALAGAPSHLTAASRDHSADSNGWVVVPKNPEEVHEENPQRREQPLPRENAGKRRSRDVSRWSGHFGRFAGALSDLASRDSMDRESSTRDTNPDSVTGSQDPPSKPTSTSRGFVGLPPIRRTSTLKVSLGTKRAKERFPLDDDDEHEMPPIPAGYQVDIEAEQSWKRNWDGISEEARLGIERPMPSSNEATEQEATLVGQEEPIYDKQKEIDRDQPNVEDSVSPEGQDPQSHHDHIVSPIESTHTVPGNDHTSTPPYTEIEMGNQPPTVSPNSPYSHPPRLRHVDKILPAEPDPSPLSSPIADVDALEKHEGGSLGPRGDAPPYEAVAREQFYDPSPEKSRMSGRGRAPPPSDEELKEMGMPARPYQADPPPSNPPPRYGPLPKDLLESGVKWQLVNSKIDPPEQGDRLNMSPSPQPQMTPGRTNNNLRLVTNTPPRGSPGAPGPSPSGHSPNAGMRAPVENRGRQYTAPRTTAPRPFSFEQPPSSAQRYPDLFRPHDKEEGPLDDPPHPDEYYQAPISREAAMLPRQQTNEYHLPGVGPPEPDLDTGRQSRRNSGFFKEIGGRIRGASRERNNSNVDDPQSPKMWMRPQNGYTESVNSVDMAKPDGPPRRGSFFKDLGDRIRSASRDRANSGANQRPRSPSRLVQSVEHDYNEGISSDLAEPEPTPSNRPRSNSFLGNIGNRIRSASRDRGLSNSSQLQRPRSSSKLAQSVEPEDQEALDSNDFNERKKRRSSLLSALSRTSAGGVATPASHESTIAHAGNSRSQSAVQSPTSPGPPSEGKQGKKYSLFPSQPKSRQDPQLTPPADSVDQAGKKKRISGLGVFGRTSEKDNTASLTSQQSNDRLKHNSEPTQGPLFSRAQSSGRPTSEQPMTSSLRGLLSTPKKDEQGRQRSSSSSSVLSSLLGGRKSAAAKATSPSGGVNQQSQRPSPRHQGSGYGYPSPPLNQDPQFQGLPQQGQYRQYHQNQYGPGGYAGGQQYYPQGADQYPGNYSQYPAAPERGRPMQPQAQPAAGYYAPGDYNYQYPRQGQYNGQMVAPLPPQHSGDPYPRQTEQWVQNPAYQLHHPQPQAPQVRVYNQQNLDLQPQSQQSYNVPSSSPSPPKPVPPPKDEHLVPPQRWITDENLLARSPPLQPRDQQRPYQLTLPSADDDEADRRRSRSPRHSRTPSKLNLKQDEDDLNRSNTHRTQNSEISMLSALQNTKGPTGPASIHSVRHTPSPKLSTPNDHSRSHSASPKPPTVTTPGGNVLIVNADSPIISPAAPKLDTSTRGLAASSSRLAPSSSQSKPRSPAELADTNPDPYRTRRLAQHEDKMLAGATSRGKGSALQADEDDDDVVDEDAIMSATSYPGQEWNPYEGGVAGWEDMQKGY